MDWTQTLTIILSNLGVLLVLFVYLMSKMDSNKKELDQKIDQFQKEVSSKFNKAENRLTAIEVMTMVKSHLLMLILKLKTVRLITISVVMKA